MLSGSVIELLNLRKMKLHCAFIDFVKAFDFVHRNSLFYKLLGYKIKGKFVSIIQNMYEDVKSYIRHNNKSSGLLKCERE